MPVDPAIQAMLDAMADEDAPSLTDMAPTEAREVMAALTAADGEPEPVAAVDDRVIGGVPTRVYRAEGTAPAGAPCLLWLHGGGFVIGDLASADPTARKLANRTGAVVVSVDYRLAPEHPFPAAPDDCRAVLEAVVADGAALGVDPRRLAVGGDSAGGNLAAVTAVAARDAGVALAHQLLVYPVTDLTMSFESIVSNGEGYLLTAAAMQWFHDHYLGTGGEAKDPMASPYWFDDLAGLAPATVITAEFDPLRDEGNAYAERLREAGVPTELRQFDGQIHGFFGLGGITPVALEAMDFAAERLRAALR